MGYKPIPALRFGFRAKTHEILESFGFKDDEALGW
jgi:hypothetical protein